METPFAVEGKVWHMLSHSVDASDLYPDYEYSYFISGDTLIAGQACKKLFSWNEDGTGVVAYKMALFDSGGKVYVIPKGTESAGVLYDFETPVGAETTIIDTVHPLEWSFDVRIYEDKTVILNGISIHALLVGRIDGNTESGGMEWPKGWWIEGVGSELGPLNTWVFGGAGNGNFLISCELGGKEIFNLSDFRSMVTSIENAVQDRRSRETRHAVYDLRGRRVTDMQPHRIYIKDGKKVAGE